MKNTSFAIDAYKIMYESRVLDEKMLVLLKQGKSFFHIGCMGHEAVQVALGMSMMKNFDFLFPYYRDQALVMSLGQSSYECLLSFLAKRDDPHGDGRQMPMHYGNKALNIITSSSSTGTQFLQAVGCAMASVREHYSNKNNPLSVTVCTAGDGTTSQGEFYEAISWASKDKLPVIFLIENNRYAISVEINEQRPGGRIADNFTSFYGLSTYFVDGCNFQESFKIIKSAIDKTRKGVGPALIDAQVVRLLPHSSSDDDKKYRSKDDLALDKSKDPIILMRNSLLEDKLLTMPKLDELEKSIKSLVESASEKAMTAQLPDSKKASDYVWSENKEPLEPKLDIDQDLAPTVMVDAINRALYEGLSEYENMAIFGQDVARGKGGVFTATRGLTEKFGINRCFNAPLAEASIVGVAIGLAIRGFKPVPEIQFADYIWTAMMQIRNELCTIRYRSNNAFSVPVIIRVPVGGYIHGGLCHSQNIEGTFAHFPGLKIALPSTAIDAYGLLKASFLQEDPVLFLEHKALYRQGFARSILPKNSGYHLPFGKGIIRLLGKDVSVISYGILVQRAMEVASKLKEEGIFFFFFDLRTIVPYDRELVFDSAKKTSRVLVLHEDMRFMGFGAEIASDISESCFKDLDAPVVRLAAKNSPVPYSQNLEDEILPQGKDIYNAIKNLINY